MASRKSWEISKDLITPEDVYFNRRQFIKQGSLLMGSLALTDGLLPEIAQAATPPAATYPAQPNPAYKVSDPTRPLTQEKFASTYNNFYEFTLSKEVKPVSDKWKPHSPWNISIGGLVDTKKTFSHEQLIDLAGGLEERVYRFRCVEAWSMVVPWTGFPLSKLIAKLKPQKGAKFVSLTSYGDAKDFPNIKGQPYYPWPYTEGLRLDEAMHPLTFVATGIYGKKLPNQHGAPIRLIVPWKYGFKSIKSMVKIEFTATQPKTLWNTLAANEYGFYANVNPEVDHPRWSQATERILDGKLFATRVKTIKFNGYESEVADLYKGMDLKKNY